LVFFLFLLFTLEGWSFPPLENPELDQQIALINSLPRKGHTLSIGEEALDFLGCSGPIDDLKVLRDRQQSSIVSLQNSAKSALEQPPASTDAFNEEEYSSSLKGAQEVNDHFWQTAQCLKEAPLIFKTVWSEALQWQQLQHMFDTISAMHKAQGYPLNQDAQYFAQIHGLTNTEDRWKAFATLRALAQTLQRHHDKCSTQLPNPPLG